MNPYDVDGVADALWQALNLPRLEEQGRMRALRRQVRGHTVFDWARACIEALQ